MNIAKEKAVELGKQIATSTYTNRHYLDRTVYTFNLEALHTLVNAAIDLYKSEQKVNTSQERVYETAKSEQMPLTVQEVEQILAQHNYELHGDRARYIVRMTEQAHGIKEPKV